MKCIVQVVGPSGSGKTASIVKALQILNRLGYRVGVLKHTHHNIDIEEKDTWRYMELGRSVFSIIYREEKDGVAGIFIRDVKDVIDLIDLIFKYTKANALIVEGFKDLNLGRKIHVDKNSNIDSIVNTLVEYITKCVDR